MTETDTIDPVVTVRLEGGNEGRCRSCRAPIAWYVTIGNRAMPFDGKPVIQNVRRDDTLVGRPWVGEITRDAVHWRTCPDAATWRRRK